MALALEKVTILVGDAFGASRWHSSLSWKALRANVGAPKDPLLIYYYRYTRIVGSVLMKDGGLPSVTDLFSGAFKIVVKQIRRDDSSRSTSSSKPQNDSLLAQVNSLRKELEFLASSGSVTITSASRSGRGTYAAPAVVIVVVGYGYIWWKGWKLSDMMFATRRSLSDASTTVAKQLDQVYLSLAATKQHLSSRIDRVDFNIGECIELTSATQDEVSQLQGDLGKFLLDVDSVRHTVQTLEQKFGEIEKKQDITTSGACVLVDFVLENGDTRESIQESPSTSSRPALEAPLTPASRCVLLPPQIIELETASPSSSTESPKVSPRLRGTTSLASSLKVSPRLRGTTSLASGLKGVIQVTSSTDEAISSSEISPVGTRSVEDPKSSGPSSSSRFGWRIPGLGAPLQVPTQVLGGLVGKSKGQWLFKL